MISNEIIKPVKGSASVTMTQEKARIGTFGVVVALQQLLVTLSETIGIKLGKDSL